MCTEMYQNWCQLNVYRVDSWAIWIGIRNSATHQNGSHNRRILAWLEMDWIFNCICNLWAFWTSSVCTSNCRLFISISCRYLKNWTTWRIQRLLGNLPPKSGELSIRGSHSNAMETTGWTIVYYSVQHIQMTDYCILVILTRTSTAEKDLFNGFEIIDYNNIYS